jgi:2-amino-4-hydroxy-6-hydroxymethyldihydropteridine diphosphokinase
MARSFKTAYLSLGSNLGDRKGQIERALELLEASGVKVVRRSSLYETEPVCAGGQRWFINCVVEVQTELMPLALLRALKRIERQLGRRPASGPQPAARSIDIDIIFYGNHVVKMPELTIPHPRLAERRFVLEPLQELGSDRRHPLTRQTVAEMLGGLRDHAAVRRVRD